MKIEEHGLVVVVHNMSDKNISELFDIIKIDHSAFSIKQSCSYTKMTYSFKDKESVNLGISKNANNLNYLRITLHGSFFDNSPHFNLEILLSFIRRFKHTFKQLDIAFFDTSRVLNIKRILHWCRNSEYYCVGDLVKLNAPKIVKEGYKFDRIQLASAKSKMAYGTIYRRGNRVIRIEIKFKSHEKITYLLDVYKNKHISKYHNRCLRSLVSCINFITSASKKSRCLSKYKMQKEWKEFIASNVKRVNWSKLKTKRIATLKISNKEKFDKSTNRLANSLVNTASRLTNIATLEDILNAISHKSGFSVAIDSSANQQASNI